MSKVVVIAVLLLVAIAAADAFRPRPAERAVLPQAHAQAPVVVHRATSGLIAVGAFTRKRVLRNGREYLSEEDVDAAFPAPLEGVPFDIAYVATAPDGTVVLAVYKFPELDPVQAALELWRDGRPLRAFSVPPGSFGGGIGFADDGRLVATLSSDGLLVHLFTRDGRPAGRRPATSW
ncbi:MAG TPA: hypothetical protein VGJ34_05075 [Gaiellaceae bacterium]|jgi:hypothetical protein